MSEPEQPDTEPGELPEHDRVSVRERAVVLTWGTEVPGELVSEVLAVVAEYYDNHVVEGPVVSGVRRTPPVPDDEDAVT